MDPERQNQLRGEMTQATVDQIVEEARARILTHGYASLRYAEIAKKLQVTRQALHYYFPSKIDLGRAVVAGYRERLIEQFRHIDATVDGPMEKLREYSGLYRQAIAAGDYSVMPGGMLAAEIDVLPEPLQVEVRSIYQANAAWVANVITGGPARKLPQALRSGDPHELAFLVVATLQGALVVCRLAEDVSLFDAAVENLLR